MLTDIFADRYSGVELWESFEGTDRRFLVQGFRIISEQLYPYHTYDGKEDPKAKAKWEAIHNKLSMELGLEELSKRAYAYNTAWQGKTGTVGGIYPINTICKNFVCADYDGSFPADRFIKERISFIEIAFRERAADIEAANAKHLKELSSTLLTRPPRRPGTIVIPGDRNKALKALNDKLNQDYRGSVDELNARFRQAGYDLNYHNGFIQRSVDPLVEELAEKPFWVLVSDGKWKNVDIDMKEAVDRRDSASRDPAFYAARALESTIKIISDENEWTHGGEKGAHNYIDNLGSKKAGNFLDEWEKILLKDFFTHVRNRLGHGPGSEEMSTLSPHQTDWAIEFSMIWVKTLIRRMQ